MIFSYAVLKVIWWMLIGALLIGFAILDGMDMGVGNLLPFIGRSDDERRVVVNAIAPHWDGNQVWLITAGGAIFAAWPIVYAAAFSGLYTALLLVLFALFFRPIGFDYRSKIDNMKWRKAWDWGLFASGAIPSIVFGVAFGNLLQGLPFHIDEYFMPHYQGSLLNALIPLLNPFALLAGLISFCMLTVHGAIWLQLRARGDITERARKIALRLTPVTILGFAGAGYWVATGIKGFRIISQPAFGAEPDPLGKVVEMATGAWLDIYTTHPAAILAPIAGFAGALLAMLFSGLRRPGLGFVSSALSIAGIISTAGLSMFPFVMPSRTMANSSLTLWDATSSHLTLTIMFWAVAIFLPIVLTYTIWSYVRMWGKVGVEDIQQNTHSVY